jgi:hypothetical protein
VVRIGGGGDRGLERKVGALLSQAQAAGERGDRAAQARLSGEAMDICRGLVERHPDDPRHVAALAGGLYNHAWRLLQIGRAGEADEVLAESRRHYTTLEALEPGRHQVALCDVLLRTALSLVMQGRYDEGEERAREALAAYAAARPGDALEREFGEVRAHSLIGRAMLLGGRGGGALAEFDAALFAGERLREAHGLSGTDFGWLERAPRSFRLAAPEWLGSAVAAMELHDAAGSWGIAADAANIAMRLGGGLAAIGDDAGRHRFQAIEARAREIWWAAQHPAQAAAQRAGGGGRSFVSGEGLVRGARREPDLVILSLLAGWGAPP